MPCGSCVDKLARKLMEHHKIDLIRAYELAEKGVERVENRPSELPKPVDPSDPYDYTQACLPCTLIGDCAIGSPCANYQDCQENFICSPNCPAPSIAHSHLESSTCNCGKGGCSCRSYKCAGTNMSCSPPTGVCYYHCDTGYVWNGSECVLAVVAVIPVGGVVQQAKVHDII
jgi:hypothetical protein